MNTDEIIRYFANLKQSGDNYTALCPCHDDKQNSLSISADNNGNTLLFCHAGCDTNDIIQHIGLKMSDLFAYKSLPAAKTKQTVVAEYIYRNADGQLLFKSVRYSPKTFKQARYVAEKKEWIYNMQGITPVIYRLPEVIHSVKNNNPVFITEGEKDVENLIKLGYSATCNPMGAGKWKEHYSAYFENAVCRIIPDNDNAGRAHAESVAKSLCGKAAEIKILDIVRIYPDIKEKGDISDVIKALGREQTAERLDSVISETSVFKSDMIPLYEYTDTNRNTISEKSKSEQQKYITVEAFKDFLKSHDISIQYNVMTRIAEIEGLEDKYSLEHLQGSFPLIVTEMVNNSHLFRKRTNKEIIQDFTSIVLTENARQYNPVLEMINNNTWDEKDRFPEIFSILNIDYDDKLSKILLYKWLWQSLSMARNELKDAYGADGLLVLQGGQGIGKTTLVSKMAVKQEFCSIGKSLNFQDKDTLRRCASAWIVELGEIETTFRSDKEKLKAFITDATDMYRLPFGRTDEHLARRTSLIGTCNSTEYLIDETGNRRFWTIPLKNIDLDTLNRFDFLQLWLQMDTVAKHNRQGFRLDKEEQALLKERNGKHEKPLKGEIEIRDILSKRAAGNRYSEKEVTITEFKMSNKALEKFDAREIGRVLDKLGIEMIRTKNGRFRKLLMLAEDFKQHTDW